MARKNEVKGILFRCKHCDREFKGTQGAINHIKANKINTNEKIMVLVHW